MARWFIRGERRRPVHTLVSKLVRDGEVIVPHGHLAGLRLVASGSSAGYLLGTTEPAVQETIVRLLEPGMTFYDVGANVGFLTVLAARSVGPTGHVYAFEPLPRNVAVLRRNLALNAFDNVTVSESAVSDGVRRGHISDRDPVMASLVVDAAPGTIPVGVVAVDELVMTGRVKPPDVVKVDVEGHEPAVIAGMSDTLRRYRPSVIYELHADDGGDPVANLLTSLGYALTTLNDPPGAMRHVLATPHDAPSRSDA